MVNRRASLFAACILPVLATGAWAGDDFADLTEFQSESRALIAATIAFFDEVEARTLPRKRVPVIGLPVTATKISAPAGENASVLTAQGPVDHLTAYGITWYPVDRLLGSVDFMGTWGGNRNLVCGYLTWDLSDAEAPRLDAVSASFVDLDELGQADTFEIHQRLLDANCAFGAIDENFHLFDVAG